MPSITALRERLFDCYGLTGLVWTGRWMKKSLGGLVSNFLIMSYIVENWITVDAPKREVMDLISERYEQGQNLWAGMIQFGRATARELESA